ncbi:uncharacterized protein BDZ99DRAFT_549055 [Mytilinidion resinicola]|uniref:F-box domain-containing protein n=1 Tax=Mytilinidion resinicola TaxID=574789 RepID=A0A6A6Z113_9PEZI|nr:uncharacterized protein BDZ99DRAFT_549055 [Mytilinidion resinicola]KAF2814852.1 hypothetical protein BDZ99DRAFT_549055 [Mytilinidion resinicola]
MNVPSTPESRDSPLLRLPNELLIEILTLAVGRKDMALDDDQSKDHKTAWSLTLVCKRISGISYPLLYRTIDFMSPTLESLIPMSRAGRLLSRSLCANPELSAMCRELVVWIPSIESGYSRDSDYEAATTLLTQLTNIQNFQSFNGLQNSDSVWRMLDQIFPHMPRITDLTMSQDYIPIFMERLFKPDNRFPALRRLHIVGCLAFSSSNIHDAVWLKDRIPPIMDLNIHDFRGSSQDFAAFLSWLEALENLTFHPDKDAWSLSLFQGFLEPHRSTLKSLYIGDQGNVDNRLDLTGYPKLEILSLPALAHRETLGDHALLLAAPKLRSFTWHFGIEQDLNSLDSFQKSEADALRTFVKTVLACGCPLKLVYIWFLANAQFSTPIAREGAEATELALSMRYPWDWMDELRDEFEEWGVLLSYDPPFDEPRSVTREQYEEEFRRWTSFSGHESDL